MGTYAVIGDVQARLAGRPTFGTGTKPTQAQVEAWIDEAEAYLTGAVTSAGISMPVLASNGGKILRSLACDYAEAHVRMAHAAAGGDGANDDGKDMLDKFFGKLEQIARDTVRWSSMLVGDASSSKIRCPPTDDSSDDFVDAEFQRGEEWQ